LAAIEKPPAPTAPDYDTRCAEIIRLLRLMSAVHVIRHWSTDDVRVGQSAAALAGSADPLRPNSIPFGTAGSFPPIVGIGASAGGPGALATVPSQLSADFPLPILVVRHLSAEFVPGLAEWLDRASSLRVRLAVFGEIPAPGTVYVAPGGT